MNNQMAVWDFMSLYDEHRKMSEEVSNFLDEHTDKDGKISAENAKFTEKKIKELEKMKNELSRAYDRLAASPVDNKPVLNKPGATLQDLQVSTAKKFGVASQNYHRAFFNEVRNKFQTAFNFLQEGDD